MRIVLVFSIFFLLVSTGWAIDCYICDSYHDSPCNGWYFSRDIAQKTDCSKVEVPNYLKDYKNSPPATGCLLKLYEDPTIKVNGKFRERVIRSCYFGDFFQSDEACHNREESLTDEKLKSCFICDKDHCISASSTFSLNKGIIFLIFLKYFWNAMTK